jgi:hypothetical protein
MAPRRPAFATLTVSRRPAQKAGRTWYTVSYGPVTIVHYSTERSMAVGDEQFLWLNRTLRSVDRRKTPWLIVTGHRATYVDSTVANDIAIQKYYQPLLDPLFTETGVDLVFFGHTHLTQRHCASYLGQCRMNSTFDPAAGANVYDSPANPVYFSLGNAGATSDYSKQGSATGPGRNYTAWLRARAAYSRMTAEASGLRVEIVDARTHAVLDVSLIRRADRAPADPLPTQLTLALDEVPAAGDYTDLASYHRNRFSGRARIACVDGSCGEEATDISYRVFQRTGCGEGPYAPGGPGAYCIPYQGMRGDIFGRLPAADGRSIPASYSMVGSAADPLMSYFNKGSFAPNVSNGVEQNVGPFNGFYLREAPPVNGYPSYVGELVSKDPDYMSLLPGPGGKVYSFVHFESPAPATVSVRPRDSPRVMSPFASWQRTDRQSAVTAAASISPPSDSR